MTKYVTLEHVSHGPSSSHLDYYYAEDPDYPVEPSLLGTHVPGSFKIKPEDVWWATPDEAEIESMVLVYRKEVEASLYAGKGLPDGE